MTKTNPEKHNPQIHFYTINAKSASGNLSSASFRSLYITSFSVSVKRLSLLLQNLLVIYILALGCRYDIDTCGQF